MIINYIWEVLAKQKYDDYGDVEMIISRTGVENTLSIIMIIMMTIDIQRIVPPKSSSQNSKVVSGGNSIGSGNNFSFQNKVNKGITL